MRKGTVLGLALVAGGHAAAANAGETNADLVKALTALNSRLASLENEVRLSRRETEAARAEASALRGRGVKAPPRTAAASGPGREAYVADHPGPRAAVEMPAHQLVPTAPEFYVGAGGAYNLGLERVVSGGGITGIFSNTFFSAEFDRRQTGGFGAIGYAGARMSFGGAWFGVEGEYMRRGGHAKTETGTPGGNIAGTVVGASTTIIESRLSDRVSASALVGVPVFGPLSLYGRAGLSWATLRESATQTYAGAVNGTTCSFVFPVGCTTAFQFSDPLIWRRSRDLVSPVVAAGVEVPLGSFFARFETEAEFLSLPNNAIVTPVVLRSTPPGAFFSGSTTAQASFTAPFGQNKDSDIAWRMSASVGARF